MRDVSVIVSEDATGKPAPDTAGLERFAANVLSGADCGDAEVNVILTNDAVLSELNKRFRNREGPTDVLSFKLSEPDDSLLIGEVYVSLERAAIQAGEYSVTFEEELVRLVTHGLLHLAGRVHDTGKLLREMSAETEMYVRRYFEGEDS